MAPKKQSQTELVAKITFKSLGRSIVVVVGKESYVFTSAEKEKRDAIKAMVEAYNKRPSQTKLDALVKAVTPKAHAKEVAQKTEKKLKHKQAKTAKVELKKVTKEKKVLLAEQAESIKEVNDYLKGDSRFIVKDGEVYLAPFMEIPMPKELVTEILNWMDRGDSLQPLINFWMLAMLNPNPIARTKLFSYLTRHKLIITPNGYFVTYRMVKQTAVKDVYTSAHTGQEAYRMGEAFRMPRAACDEDGKNDCSRGLHTGTPAFIGIQLGDGYSMGTRVVSKAQGGGYGTGYDAPRETKERFDNTFGNQAVIVLVNPMHVVSVPNSDTRKMRSCELFFVKTTTAEEVVKMQLSDYALYDQSYKEFEKEELEKMLKQTKLEHYVDKAANATGAKKLELEHKIKQLQEQVNLGGDKPSQQGLNMELIRQIIKSRTT